MDDTVGAAKKKEVPRPVAADSGLPRDPNGEPLPVPTKGEETLTVVGLADKDDDVVNGTSEKVTDAKGDDKAADDNDDVSNEGSQQSAECMSSAAKIYMTAYFGKSRQTEQEPILYDHGSGDDYSAAGTIDSVASILAARTTQPAGKSSQTNATNGKETAENMFEPNDEDVELAIEPKSTTLNMNDQKPAGRKRVYLVIAALICLLLAVVVIGIVMGLNSTEDSSGDSASIQDESEPPVDEPQTTEPISQTDAPASSSSVTPTSLYGPTNSPTLSPTSTPSFAPSVSLIDPLIEFLQGYQVSVSKDPLSPSYMAVQWLAEEAADIIINGGELVFDDQLVQRFAILALDYSLNRTAVANWTQMTKSENTTKTPAFSPFTMFESVGIKGENECTWPGIICHNDTDIVSEIHFGRLGMSGTISPEVRLLSDLTVFDVAGNSIQGSIPEELYELTLLEEIYLYQNQLTGTISSKIGDLNNVTTIHLSQNLLTGSIPESLRSGNISRPLKYFNLYSNKLTGTIPEDLRLRDLVTLDLGRNQLVGTVDAIDDRFPSLRMLFLDNNQFNGTISSTLINTGNGRLEALGLDNNQFTGEVPGDHTNINTLFQFTLQGNQFTSLGKETCKLSVFEGGEMVEFRADCDICDCGLQCDQCNGDDAAPDGEGKPMKL